MTERELSRGAARRLAIIHHVEEVTGNVAMTCRYFGISRHTYYFWVRRYQQLGPEGLRERSRRPLVCPHATKAEVVGKIIHLRQHDHFGPAKIAMYLKRYHDVAVSPSGIWRILKRANLNRLHISSTITSIAAASDAGNGSGGGNGLPVLLSLRPRTAPASGASSVDRHPSRRPPRSPSDPRRALPGLLCTSAQSRSSPSWAGA